MVGVLFQQWWQHVKYKPCTWPCTTVAPQNAEHLHQLITGNCEWSWILASVHWRQWWQSWNIPKFVQGGSHKCWDRKNTVCKFSRTYWDNMRLKVTISCIAASLVMRHGVTTTGWSPSDSLWSGDMRIPLRRISSKCRPQCIKWFLLGWKRSDPS